MSRISIKIISIIILCIILVVLSTGTLSLYSASSIINEEIYEKLSYISKNYANKLSYLLSGVENTVNTISSVVQSDFNTESFISDSDFRSDYMMKTDKLLYTIGADNDFIQGIYLNINPELTGEVFASWYINDQNDNFIYQEAEHISTFYPENEDMKWYYDPVKTGTGVWSTPYTDATINVKMISYTKAVYSGSELIGVAGIDISFEEILSTVKELIIHETGYGILIDSNYNVIFHPNHDEGINIGEVDNENLDVIIDAMNKRDSDVLQYHYKKTDKIMGYSKLSNGWIFMAAVSLDEINKRIVMLRQNIAFAVLISIIVGIFVSMKMAKSITYQLNKLHDMTEQIGNGNYDISIEVKSDDEIGKLFQSFIIMGNKLSSSQKKLLDLNKEMEFMAFHDPLTHLPNRRFGMNQLTEMLDNYNESLDLCGIMSIDLDKFKQINDTWGHDAGDRILIHASELMNHMISSRDMLCRIGGDEFMIIFMNVPDFKRLTEMAERIVFSDKEAVIHNGNKIKYSCSIGIVIIKNRETSLEEILKRADIALYSVKESGRNNFKIFNE